MIFVTFLLLSAVEKKNYFAYQAGMMYFHSATSAPGSEENNRK